METSLFIRLYLIMFSVASLVLQMIGLTGNNWYGFSLTLNMNSKNVTGKMHGGLLVFSPFEICEGDDALCKNPNQFSAYERTTSEELNRKFSDILLVLRSLVITGITSSTFGGVILCMYLWVSKNPRNLVCTGTSSAVFWMFTVLPEYIAVGIQVYVNMNIKKTSEDVPVGVHNQGQFSVKFSTPWDVTIIGVGATLAFVDGVVIFMTTLDKRNSTSVVGFRKHPELLDEMKVIHASDDYTDEEEI